MQCIVASLLVERTNHRSCQPCHSAKSGRCVVLAPEERHGRKLIGKVERSLLDCSNW